MNNRPVYENLDTSFVNLSALIRYLRRQEFAGRILIELHGYEAEIFLSKDDGIKVSEHDRIAGRVAEGDEALQRLLIRAREAGGKIHVYQEISERSFAYESRNRANGLSNEIKINPPTTIKQKHSENDISQIDNISVSIRMPTAKKSQTLPADAAEDESAATLPLEFSNKFENKAKKLQTSPQEWQVLLSLVAEILKTVEGNLAKNGLEFAPAFRKARAEISADYPFLHPDSGDLRFENGILITREQISTKLFTASITEILRRILEKLGANQKFSEAYRMINQDIITLIHKNKAAYDKFELTAPLEKIVGI